MNMESSPSPKRPPRSRKITRLTTLVMTCGLLCLYAWSGLLAPGRVSERALVPATGLDTSVRAPGTVDVSQPRARARTRVAGRASTAGTVADSRARDARTERAARVLRETRVYLDDTDGQLQFEELRTRALEDPAGAATPLADYVLNAAGDARKSISCLAAIAMLGDMPGEDSANELQRIYSMVGRDMKLASARALERQGDARMMYDEMRAMERDFLCSDAAGRLRKARRTAQLGSPCALPLLCTMMSDASTEIRMEAASGLGRIEGAAARAELELARQDPEPTVRARVQELLLALTPDETP